MESEIFGTLIKTDIVVELQPKHRKEKGLNIFDN